MQGPWNLQSDTVEAVSRVHGGPFEQASRRQGQHVAIAGQRWASQRCTTSAATVLLLLLLLLVDTRTALLVTMAQLMQTEEEHVRHGCSWHLQTMSVEYLGTFLLCQTFAPRRCRHGAMEAER